MKPVIAINVGHILVAGRLKKARLENVITINCKRAEAHCVDASTIIA